MIWQNQNGHIVLILCRASFGYWRARAHTHTYI